MEYDGFDAWIGSYSLAFYLYIVWYDRIQLMLLTPGRGVMESTGWPTHVWLSRSTLIIGRLATGVQWNKYIWINASLDSSVIVVRSCLVTLQETLQYSAGWLYNVQCVRQHMVHTIKWCMPAHGKYHHMVHASTWCMPSNGACHHMVNAITCYTPAHGARQHMVHAITWCTPAHDARQHMDRPAHGARYHMVIDGCKNCSLCELTIRLTTCEVLLINYVARIH